MNIWDILAGAAITIVVATGVFAYCVIAAASRFEDDPTMGRVRAFSDEWDDD